MPLVVAPQGKVLKIMRVGKDEKLRRHLESLGIIAGAEITVLSSSNGSVIVQIGNGRLALSSSVATSVLVNTV